MSDKKYGPVKQHQPDLMAQLLCDLGAGLVKVYIVIGESGPEYCGDHNEWNECWYYTRDIAELAAAELNAAETLPTWDDERKKFHVEELEIGPKEQK